MTGSALLSIARRLLLFASAALAAGCASLRSVSHPMPGDDLSAYARLGGGTGNAAPWKKKLADRYFFEGSLMQMQERYPDAIIQFQHVLRLNPWRAEAQFAIARCYHALGINDTALLYAQQSVSRPTPSVDARAQFAELLVINGEVEQGIDEYEQVLKEQPEDISARYNVARLLQRRNPDRAIFHYEYIRQNLAEDYDALLNLAELYVGKRSFDSAVEVMRQVIALDPADPDLYKLMEDVYLRADRYGDAIRLIDEAERHILPASAFQRYLIDRLNDLTTRLVREPQTVGITNYARSVAEHVAERFPKQWKPLFSSAVVRFHLGDSLAADSLLHVALADKTSPPSAWSDAAELFLDTGEEPRGLKLLAPIAVRHRSNAHVLDLLGTLYFSAGHPDSAEKYLRASLALEEENSSAWGRLGLLYSRQGKPGASDAAYDKALLYDPDNTSVLNNFAYALAERGRQLDRALEMIRQALDIEPENESYLDTYGWIYFKQGEYQKALQYIQHSVDIGGASAEVLAHLGDVQQALGDTQAARTAYERALKLAPADRTIRKRLDEVR
jgi:tetratricopeptide (TPR) repeat protein